MCARLVFVHGIRALKIPRVFKTQEARKIYKRNGAKYRSQKSTVFLSTSESRTDVCSSLLLRESFPTLYPGPGYKKRGVLLTHVKGRLLTLVGALGSFEEILRATPTLGYKTLHFFILSVRRVNSFTLGYFQKHAVLVVCTPV